MYGYDYAYEPATEGLAEIGNWVTAKIQAAKDMIKKAIDAVKAKLRMMSGKAENVKSNSSEATDLVDDIKDKTKEILKATVKEIADLYDAFDVIAEKSEKSYTGEEIVGDDNVARYKDPDAFTKWKKENLSGASFNAGAPNNSRKDGKITTTYKGWSYGKGGMKKISKDATSEQLKTWEEHKRNIGKNMAEQAEAAELVKADLKKLMSYGPLTKTATEHGYNGLREVFATNEEVMKQWRQVRTATEWSVGEIHKILSKIMNLYDVGIKAIDAFGKRLISGNYRQDDGTRYEGKDIKAAKARWKSETSLDKEARTKKSKWDSEFAQKESAAYVLDRIYQAAYEDALEDIAEAEYYEQVLESVPDYMPGFDDYLEDAEYYPDNY